MLPSLWALAWKQCLQKVRLYRILLYFACGFARLPDASYPWPHRLSLCEQYVENFAANRSWNDQSVVFVFAILFKVANSMISVKV